MARKKASQSQHIPLEETAEFLAVLAELPAAGDVGELERLAGECLALYNDAIRGNSPAHFELAKLRRDAVVYRLNGDSFFGCGADDGSKTHLLKVLAAEPGQVPCWGQDGKWFLEVNGMRMWVNARNWMSETVSLEFFAIDADQPFISPTGYLSHYLHPEQWFSHELGAAVRLELERCMPRKDWRPVPIKPDYRQRIEAPSWAASALEGVTRNGQQALPLSGLPQAAAVAAAPVEKKIPMDNAERQRRHRQRQKEKREQAKAEGRRTVELSGADLGRLFIALDTHIAFDKPLDWDLQGYRELAGRLFAGDALVHHIHLLGTSDGVGNRQKQQDKDAKRGWEAYERERERTSGLINKVNDLQAENAHIKRELAAIAAELGGAPVTTAAPAVDVAALQAELARVHAECERLELERCKAFAAVQVFEDRLRAHGLPTDYRQQLVV